MVLIDSSAWIEYLRNTDSPADRAVAASIADGTAATTDAVLLEVLAGTARNVLRKVERLLGNQNFIAQAALLDVRAAVEVYHACRRAGSTPRSTTDCLIAAVAIRADLPVLHCDRDFDAIARSVPLRVATT